MQKLQCAVTQCDKIISDWEEIFKIALIAVLTNQNQMLYNVW